MFFTYGPQKSWHRSWGRGYIKVGPEVGGGATENLAQRPGPQNNWPKGWGWGHRKTGPEAGGGATEKLAQRSGGEGKPMMSLCHLRCKVVGRPANYSLDLYAAPFHTLQKLTVLNSTAFYCMTCYYKMLYCARVHCTTFCCTVLYCNTLYFTSPCSTHYYIEVYCTAVCILQQHNLLRCVLVGRGGLMDREACS